MDETSGQGAPPPSRVALVTGASRGLGAALACALGASGDHVIAVARTTGGLEELDDRIRGAGGSATLAPLDVTDAEAMQRLCKAIHERWGGLDLWLHTAVHAAPLTPAPQIDDKDWHRSWQTNVEATRRLIAYVAPLLQARPGAQAAFFDDPRAGQPYFGSYGASKAAQMALARSWQAETRRLGPRVVVLSPPGLPTASRARFFPGEDRSALTEPDAAAAALLADIAAAADGV